MTLRLVLIAIIILTFSQGSILGQAIFKKTAPLMGSHFELTVVADNVQQADSFFVKGIEEIERIENIISEWRPHTEVSKINQQAGIAPVKVSQELLDLTVRALDYSKMSGGAFDISIAALDKVWRFDGTMEEQPTPEQISLSVKNVGYKDIQIDTIASTIFLSRTGMKIGFGSIGKGYAADRARAILKVLGVQAGIVNASGDLATWGQQPDGSPWKIGVTNPFRRSKTAKVLKLREGAVATSGSYAHFVEFDNVRYSHIINPLTGYPATGLTSVTISGQSAEFSNALSTAVMVLGEQSGKKLLTRFPAYDYLLITDKGKIKRKR